MLDSPLMIRVLFDTVLATWDIERVAAEKRSADMFVERLERARSEGRAEALDDCYRALEQRLTELESVKG